jgi:hypothetical protein
MTAPEVLRLLCARRVRIWAAGGRLKFNAGGALPADLRAMLVAHKAALLAVLARPGLVVASTDPAAIGGRWDGSTWIPPAD